MYAVIFRASTKDLDNEYSQLVEKLRSLAFEKYNCIEFTAVTEGCDEIAISYWHSLEDITNWKNDALHQKAQQLGQQKWYQKYRVQIVEILRDYPHQ